MGILHRKHLPIKIVYFCNGFSLKKLEQRAPGLAEVNVLHDGVLVHDVKLCGFHVLCDGDDPEHDVEEHPYSDVHNLSKVVPPFRVAQRASDLKIISFNSSIVDKTNCEIVHTLFFFISSSLSSVFTSMAVFGRITEGCGWGWGREACPCVSYPIMLFLETVATPVPIELLLLPYCEKYDFADSNRMGLLSGEKAIKNYVLLALPHQRWQHLCAINHTSFANVHFIEEQNYIYLLK